jgi:hypothetical protein
MGPVAAAAADLQAVHATVLKLVRELEGGKPVHIAKLSFAYAKQAGHSVKKDHKPGMRHLIATQVGRLPPPPSPMHDMCRTVRRTACVQPVPHVCALHCMT